MKDLREQALEMAKAHREEFNRKRELERQEEIIQEQLAWEAIQVKFPGIVKTGERIEDGCWSRDIVSLLGYRFKLSKMGYIAGKNSRFEYVLEPMTYPKDVSYISNLIGLGYYIEKQESKQV
jgi:hypothetical protein